MSQSPPRKRKMTPTPHDTPPRPKKIDSSQSYQSGRLEEARVVVLDDLGPRIPMISFQDFLKHLAPPQPQFNLDRTMESLKQSSGDSEPVLTSSNRWSRFPTIPKSSRSEDNIFSPIPDIFKEVVDAIIKNSNGKLKVENRTIDFLQNPNRAPTSAERHNESRPDGYLVLKNRKKDKVHWADIALSCEYKLKDNQDDKDDDVRKIIWSLQHVMRDDARRRASFGMTIENTTTRLWFCCRSVVIVTESFNFIDKPEEFVRLFAAFAFADETSLGFDTTVQPVTGQDGKFRITVHPHNDKKNPRRFQTTNIISSSGADPLRGRGTRVFKAVELDGDDSPIGPNVVVKDIWIDSDRMREGNILDAIREAAEGEDKQLLKHFLTTICHGDVLTGHGNVDDTAIDLLRELNVFRDHHPLFELQGYRIIQDIEPASGQGLKKACLTRAPHTSIRYSHKTHYRIVFKEVCTTIDCMTSFPCVMTVLAETTSALRLLRKLGWVHRDVSIGNILSLDGHAKLADLEYAKKTSNLTSHETRTGTKDFMSIEVAARRFMFSGELPEPSKGGPSIPPDYLGTLKRDIKANIVVPFVHNHLHDLESLWWVAVWMVFYNHLSKAGDHPPTLQDTKNQIHNAKLLFPSSFGVMSRRDCFESADHFQKTYSEVTEDKKIICQSLNDLRKELILNYNRIEAKYPIINPGLSTDDIYKSFISTFTFLETSFDDLTLDFITQ